MGSWIFLLTECYKRRLQLEGTNQKDHLEKGIKEDRDQQPRPQNLNHCYPNTVAGTGGKSGRRKSIRELKGKQGEDVIPLTDYHTQLTVLILKEDMFTEWNLVADCR